MIMPNLKDEGSFLLALPFRKQLVGTKLRDCVGWGLHDCTVRINKIGKILGQSHNVMFQQGFLLFIYSFIL